jgi:hypothetical protein
MTGTFPFTIIRTILWLADCLPLFACVLFEVRDAPLLEMIPATSKSFMA